MTIRKLDVKPGCGFCRVRAPDYVPIGATDKRKATVEHAFVAQSPQELRQRGRLDGLALQDVPDALPGPRHEGLEPFALARRRPGQQDRLQPCGPVVETVALLCRVQVKCADGALPGACEPLGGPPQGRRNKTRIEPDSAFGKTVAFLRRVQAKCPDGPFPRARQPLGGAIQWRGNKARIEAHGAALELAPRAVAEMAQRLAEPGACRIEALTRDGEQVLRAR